MMFLTKGLAVMAAAALVTSVASTALAIESSASLALACRTGSSERHERSAVASLAATCGLRFSTSSTVFEKNR